MFVCLFFFKGNSYELLQAHSDKLIEAISDNLLKVANGLYARGLVSSEIRRNMLRTPNTDSDKEITDYSKAIDLVFAIESGLASSIDPSQYLIDTCFVLLNQKHQGLTDIAASILIELGECVINHARSWVIFVFI